MDSPVATLRKFAREFQDKAVTEDQYYDYSNRAPIVNVEKTSSLTAPYAGTVTLKAVDKKSQEASEVVLNLRCDDEGNWELLNTVVNRSSDARGGVLIVEAMEISKAVGMRISPDYR